jgi:hypothetical protein
MQMTLQPGDYVQTIDGRRGTVLQISRLTVFVSFPSDGKDHQIEAFLESDLEKIEPSQNSEGE